MDQEKKIIGVVGLFDDPDRLIEAAEGVRQSGVHQWDCHTPYPVHGLEKAMGLKSSPIPKICLFIGFVGAALAMLMQGWMNATDYPIVIGGKPLFSWQAFVPITFELFVLFTALSTVGCLVFFCRLWRWHSPLHDSGIMAQVTGDRFAVVVKDSDPHFDRQEIYRVFEQSGCEDIRELWEFEEEVD